MLLSSICFAENSINEKYSYKDFSDKSFTELNASEFSNSIIVGSCFYMVADERVEIFPEDMENVEFKNCNLDNINLENYQNITLTGTTTNKRIVTDEANNQDKIVDENGNFLSFVGVE